ncbi:MAG: hypothetical protein HGA95_03515, partial [Caldiserica bacterium]|nr:hypothetical protein [Caldisericota bacterium]
MKRFIILLTALFLPFSNTYAAITKMSYAGCTCVCNGDEISPANNGSLVIVADAGKGLLFRYTLNGTFAGYIGSAIECKPAYPFKPIRIVSAGIQIHALNMAGKTIDTIGSNGELMSSMSLAEAGLAQSTPTSYAFGNDINFISFTDGTLVACEYDLTVIGKTKLENEVWLSYSNDKLYALTSKGRIHVFDNELKEQESLEIFKYLPAFLKNPQDIFVDLQDNIWIADTGNRRVVVLWNDGTFSTWGQTAKSYELKEISGDPVAGKPAAKLAPRRVAASGDYFFISTADHQSFSIPVENLTARQSFGHKYCIRLRMPGEKYRKNIEHLWDLQQNLYPQTSLMVTTDESDESIFINGIMVDASIDDMLTDCDYLSCILGNVDSQTDESLEHYTEKNYLVLERDNPGKDILIACIDKLAGGTNPLQTEPAGRVVMLPEDLKTSFKLPTLERNSIYVVSIYNNTGKFMDFFFVSLQQ